MNENAVTGRARAREADTEADAGHQSADTRTRGAVMLNEFPGSVRALASQLGVGRTSVSDWRAGRATPNEEFRAVVARVCGIPARAWDERVAAPEPTSASLDDDDSVDALFDLAESSLRVLCARQSLIEKQGAGATTAEIVNVSKEIRAHMQETHKREIGQEAFERRVEQAVINPARQPFYQRAVNAVVDALKPHPEALKDVLSALDAAAEEVDA